MTVIDIETRQPTDRAVSFSERVIDDFITYCNAMGIAVCIQLIESEQQQLWVGQNAYSEDMLGLLEVTQSRINRYMTQSEAADDETDVDDIG